VVAESVITEREKGCVFIKLAIFIGEELCNNVTAINTKLKALILSIGDLLVPVLLVDSRFGVEEECIWVLESVSYISQLEAHMRWTLSIFQTRQGARSSP
jgi:hypothetical protein